jgi:hypothetical protein
MSTVPSGTRFIGIASNVNLVEKKSALINSETQPFTIEDIIDSVPSGSSGFNMPINQVLSPGLKYSVALTGTNPSNTGQSPNLMALSPFIPAKNLTISNLSIQVATGVASALSKILIYANVNGRPDGLLIESVDLDCSTLGTKTYNTVYTFEAGTTYWIGIISNSTQSIRSAVSSDLMSIGIAANANNTYTVLVTTGYLYTDPIPTDPTSLFLSNGSVPMVMLQ